ncbi:hypothetical protein B0O80DRAFT_498267 [Mortierella sp. GBAus27b]|nr:hypothetical protein BGX31_011574 [Mortierella sp. GBA43]KAI8354242.1 hypothetical protein B0O80DRAFT_498267 [Mortierella sp. GBAus27b]
MPNAPFVPQTSNSPAHKDNTASLSPAEPAGDHSDDWDFKLATLFSIFESTPASVLERALVDAKGDLEQAIPLILSTNSTTETTQHTSPTSSSFSRSTSLDSILSSDGQPKRKKQRLVQPRLSAFLPSLAPSASKSTSSSPLTNQSNSGSRDSESKEPTASLPSLNDRLRWKESLDDTPSSSSLSSREKAPKPLVLYSPDDVAKHCPCTLLFNVLDKDLATRLLQAMLKDSETWNRNRWWLFDRMVESPHKTSYFAERESDMEEVSGWTYNGMKQDPPRRFLPEMEEAKMVVRRIVNELRKTRTIHPYEVQGDWNCNVAAVNHYAHSKESVGWHADKLTYLGPRPTIGSLTLGATRFFRIRKVVPDVKNPDTAGQLISIALPHNSLCIMWPPMQEEWKHEIPPQATVTPHPISGTARINITFRLRREGFSPEDTPVCKCGVAMVLRCVFKNKANYGRYFYMCYASGSQEGRTCGSFQWVDMEEKFKLKPSQASEVEASEAHTKGNDVGPDTIDRGKEGDGGLDLADELDDADLELLPLEPFNEDDLTD